MDSFCRSIELPEGVTPVGEMIVILLFLYAFVFIHLIRHAADVLREEWKQEQDRKDLARKLLILCGGFILLLLIDFLVLNVGREHAGSGVLQYNAVLGVIVFSGLLALFARRKILAAFMGCLYIYDLIMFHYYGANITGNGLDDFGLGLNSMFSSFMNLIVAVAALLLDRAVPLEEPDDTIV